MRSRSCIPWPARALALKAIAKALTRSEESVKDRAKLDKLTIAKSRQVSLSYNVPIRLAAIVSTRVGAVMKEEQVDAGSKSGMTNESSMAEDPSTAIPPSPLVLGEANEDVRGQPFLASPVREVIRRNHSRMKSIAWVNGNSATVPGDFGGHFIVVI